MIYKVLVWLRFFLQNNILQYYVAGVGNQMSNLRQRPGRSSMRTTLSVQCHLVRFHHIKYIFKLTILAGVIERNPELFKPRLPKEKISSMQKMVFGTVNKIFIAYEKPFLHPDITEVDLCHYLP